MTEQTLKVIETVRRVVRGEIAVEFTPQEQALAEAILELAGGRPNVIDQRRVESR